MLECRISGTTTNGPILAAGAAGACFMAEPYRSIAESLHRKIKITDVKCMIVRGTWDWNLIKIETDAGITGIGEAYWGPGVKDLVMQQLKPLVVGEDPLNVGRLYTKMLMRSAGAIGGVTVTAASGIEIALWDLAGKILQTPVCNLLGGRYRDRVRFYRTLQAPVNLKELSSSRDQAAEAKGNNPYGFTAFRFQGDSIPITADLADLYYVWTAAHNPASPIGTIASVHAAASMRDFRIHELAKWIDWWPTLVTHEGPFWKDGYYVIEDRPGLGVEIDPDVAKAHLAPGEEWWG